MRIKIGFILIVAMLVLSGCGTKEMIYKKGLPEEPSLEVLTFLKDYISNNTGEQLIKKGDVNIYARVNFSVQDYQIQYYTATDESISNLYQSLLKNKSLNDKFTDSSEKVKKPISKLDQYDLPLIKKDKNKLVVKKENTIKTFDLQGSSSDKFMINLTEYSEEGFVINVYNETSKKSSLLFLNKNLKNSKLITNEMIKKEVEKGSIKEYYGILKKTGKYVILSGNMVIDSETNEVFEVGKLDLLSRNGEYIYINSREKKIKEGEQRIQTIENYVNGEENYVRGIKLDYGEIQKEMDIESSGLAESSVLYFNDNFIFIRVRYNGVMVGTAGAANIMIQLNQQKDQPTAHIVDLGVIEM